MIPDKIVDYRFLDKHSELEYSIVMPIHNQEDIIKDVLARIFQNTVDDYQLILILDACTDKSEKQILESITNLPTNLKILQIYKYNTPAFETTCDNFGFKNSVGKYIVEVQADIYIYTYGYNRILTQPFRKFNDVVTVSGRCVHNLFNWNEGKGKLGLSIELPLENTFDNYDIFYVGDTCNRGPWALDREKLHKLNYLDEENFVLGDDDHDLNIRGAVKHGWVCGYVPIEIKSIIREGSTRKQRDSTNTTVLQQRLQKSTGGFLKEVREGRINFNSKNIQIRKL